MLPGLTPKAEDAEGQQTAEAQLRAHIMALVDRPLAFVYYIYPWGQPDTPLAQEEGPEAWQIQALQDLETALHTPGEGAVRVAVSSGNGIGKGALTAWLVHWFASTRPNGQGVVTANTKTQLETKTWREVAKWNKLARNGHWFEWSATKYTCKAAPETWFTAAIPWSERNAEAFAGTHEDNVLVIFDEASGIPAIIWDTAEGAFTHKGAIQFAFGNPTQNQGRFKEIFPGGRFAHRWKTYRVDSRTTRRGNHAQHQQWIEDYGLESDFVKIHVLGQHPSQSIKQFIGEDIVKKAQQRDLPFFHTLPKVLGVDVARTGANATVLLMRQGHRILWKRKYRGILTDETAGLVREVLDKEHPDATFIDAVGIGAGVYDQLRHTNHVVHAVQSAARFKAKTEAELKAGQPPERYYNKRAQMWGRCRDWLDVTGCLPLEDEELARQLQAPEYTYAGVDMILIESKEDMLERGIESPDDADSLVLTFAEPVEKRQEPQGSTLPTQFAHGTRMTWQGGGQNQRAVATARPWSRR